jgi:hypothetical protein
MLGNYRVAAQLVASRAVLSSTELVSYIYDHLRQTVPTSSALNGFHLHSTHMYTFCPNVLLAFESKYLMSVFFVSDKQSVKSLSTVVILSQIFSAIPHYDIVTCNWQMLIPQKPGLFDRFSELS